MLIWIYANKEWIFSGFGVAAIAGLATLLRSRRQDSTTSSENLNQKQRGGRDSVNVQVGKIEGKDR